MKGENEVLRPTQFPHLTSLYPTAKVVTTSITAAERPKRRGSAPNFVGDSIGSRGAAVAPDSLSNEVHLLQKRARVLRVEDAQIEKVQVGTRKRGRGAGPAASVEGKSDTKENGQVHDTIYCGD